VTQNEIAKMAASVPLLHKDQPVPFEEVFPSVNSLVEQLKKLKKENEILKQKLDFHGLL
jgi:hypothetical protein